MEASLEHLKRGTARYVDTMLVALEPYYRSLETAARTSALATELGIKRVYAVANKVRNNDDEKAIAQFCEKHHLNLVATIPYDEAIMEADKIGLAPMDYDVSSIAVLEIMKLADTLESVGN